MDDSRAAIKQADPEYWERTIIEAEKTDTGFLVTCANQFEFFCPEKTHITPKKGQVVRCYGDMLGMIRGIDINGHELFYITPDEAFQHFVPQLYLGNGAYFE